MNESKLIQLQIIESHRDFNTIYSVKINYRGPNVGIYSKPFQPAAAMNEIPMKSGNCLLYFVSHQQAEERASHAQREKAELESQIEDQEEDYNELLKKHKALTNQVSTVYREMVNQVC